LEGVRGILICVNHAKKIPCRHVEGEIWARKKERPKLKKQKKVTENWEKKKITEKRQGEEGMKRGVKELGTGVFCRKG